MPCRCLLALSFATDDGATEDVDGIDEEDDDGLAAADDAGTAASWESLDSCDILILDTLNLNKIF